jgi:hypothetical protein
MIVQMVAGARAIVALAPPFASPPVSFLDSTDEGWNFDWPSFNNI